MKVAPANALPSRAASPHHSRFPRPACLRWSPGFSLVELLLATALLLLLVSAVAFNFSTTQTGSELVTGVERFESLLHYCRAQAAYSGRRVQIRFEPGSAGPAGSTLYFTSLAHEPDPLQQPNQFEPLALQGWDLERLNRLVGIQKVHLPGRTPPPPARGEGLAAFGAVDLVEPENPPPAPITFQPDGTADSAQITLVSRSEDDPRMATIYFSGLTGSMYHQIRQPEEEDPFATTPGGGS